MKNIFLNIFLITFVLFTSCKDKTKTIPINGSSTSEVILKQEINIDYAPIYLSPKAKPIISNWKEYIDVQKKVYDLKNTDTVKLNEQLDELDDLISKLLNSQFPTKLQTHLFERKLYLLGESVSDLRNLLGKENISIDDIKKRVFKIIEDYSSSKNQINAIYGG
ncbi:MAG TPA: hypothetical protein VKY41_05370 [Xanthomarina sp.]|nr:hypothetical protein [Xanthomarina sp.]